MSRAVICLFLFFIGISTTEVSNNTDLDFEMDSLHVMQKFEETARRQWELSSRKKPTTDEKELEQNSPTSETVELFTWFPWYQKNGPTIHTIKALATIKKENASKLPQILGVGSWHEITLFGKKKEVNAIEEPDASALCRRGLAINSARTSTWVTTIMLFLCFITT